MGKKCFVVECESNAVCRGLCKSHYMRQWRYGSATAPLRLHRYHGALCAVRGCTRKAHSNELCQMHWRRVKVHGQAGPAERMRLRYEANSKCMIDGCGGAPVARGMCKRHSEQSKRRPDLFSFQVSNRTDIPRFAQVYGNEVISRKRFVPCWSCGSAVLQFASEAVVGKKSKLCQRCLDRFSEQGRDTRGSKRKFDDLQIKAIRMRHSSGESACSIAKKLMVSHTAILDIVNRVTYREIA